MILTYIYNKIIQRIQLIKKHTQNENFYKRDKINYNTANVTFITFVTFAKTKKIKNIKKPEEDEKNYNFCL